MSKTRKVVVKSEPWEYLAMGSLFLAVIALSLIRIDTTDTPWHLATAKYAFGEGHWPIRNTFSYTYPDYPLYQQYPIYQTILYLVYRLGGWEGLSFLLCALWVTIFSLWMIWASSGSRPQKFLALAWMLGLLGFQQRMILRPDILSILLLISLLLFIDLYRKGQTWATVLFVAVQWSMVNSHQLFPLGLAIQGAFFVHLILVRLFGGRHGIARIDSMLPIWPIILAVIGSIVACFMSPLGVDIVRVPTHTASSLYYHAKDIQEFAPFYASRYALLLVVLSTTLMVVGIWRQRRQWQPFEVGLWLIGAAVLSVAIRGVALYVLICVAIFGRSFAGDEVPNANMAHRSTEGERAPRVFRIFCAAATLFLCGEILYFRWVAPERILGGTQPGIGLSLGDWPSEAIKFIRQNPPPGRMINLSWYSGNPLILELFPQHPVFVDPRFESYPRDFLIQAIEGGRKREALDRLILQYQPDWMVAELRDSEVLKLAGALVKEGSWELVHADSVFLILVRNLPKNCPYISRHKLKPEEIAPSDLLWTEPDLLALQQLRLADLYTNFGLHTRAEDMIQKARAVATSYPSVRHALREMDLIPK